MKRKIFNRSFEYLWIALIITLLLASTFDQYEYAYDQLRNLIVSDEILEGGIPTYFGQNFYKHPPLFYYLISLLGLSGISLYSAGQAIVLLFAFLSIVFMYKLGNELFSRNFARVSSVVLGVSLPFWLWGNRILHETTVFFFFTASLYFLLIGIKKGKTRDWVMLGVILGLGLLAKVVVFLVIPIAFVFAILSPEIIRFRKRVSYVNLGVVKKALISLFIAFLVYSPYLTYNLVNSIPGVLETWVEHIRGDIPWAGEVVSFPWHYYISNLHLTLSIPLTILFLIGLLFMAIRRERRLLLPLSWFLVVIAFFSLPAYKEYRLISSLLPAAVLIGVYGIFELSKTMGKIGKIKTENIFLTLSVLVITVQIATTLPVVLNDGHWPADWEMWEYLKGIEDDGGVIVSDYEYTSIRYFTGKHSEILAWGVTEHDILDGMMESSVYYIYRNSVNVSEEHFQKIREFEECDCSLYRIRNELMENVTFLKVYSNGKPLEGATIRVFDQNAEIVFKTRSNRDGEAFLPLADGYYNLKGGRICYENTDAYVEIRENEAYECELIAKFAVPFVVKCYEKEYEMNFDYRGCLNHGFTEGRF